MTLDDLVRKSNYELKFQKTISKQDPILGEYHEYINSSTNQKVIATEIITTDRKALLIDIEYVKQRIINKNDYLLNYLDYSVEV